MSVHALLLYTRWTNAQATHALRARQHDPDSGPGEDAL